MNGEQDDVTIDDLELLIWRTLGIKDVGQVDNLLRAIQVYAEARVERDRVLQYRRGERVVQTPSTAELDEEYGLLIGGLEEKYPIQESFARDLGHPPYAKEDPDHAYARDGHPPFSGVDEFTKSKEIQDNSRDYGKVTDEDFAGMLADVLSQSSEEGGEPGEDMDELLRCARCERMKKRDRFAKDRSRKRGRRWKCRMCEAEVRIERARARVNKG